MDRGGSLRLQIHRHRVYAIDCAQGGSHVLDAALATQPGDGKRLTHSGIHPFGGMLGLPNFRNRKLLETTKKDEKAIAAPAISGLSMPAAAIGMAATL